MLGNLKFGALLIATLSLILLSVNASEMNVETDVFCPMVADLETLEESEALEDDLTQIHEETKTVLWHYDFQNIYFFKHTSVYRLDLSTNLRPPWPTSNFSILTLTFWLNSKDLT